MRQSAISGLPRICGSLPLSRTGYIKPESPIEDTRDLGWMLYDLDFTNRMSPIPRFFRAFLKNGVVEVPGWSNEEVRG